MKLKRYSLCCRVPQFLFSATRYRFHGKGAITSPGRYAVIGCKLKQNANEGYNSCATVVQVFQDLLYVLLHVLLYL